MITVTLSFHENTLVDLVKAATSQGLDFNKYVEMRLNADLDQAVEEEPESSASASLDVEEIAKDVFQEALHYPAEKSYLVEKIYSRLNKGEWGRFDRGVRIMIGKAFKRLVDAQLAGGTHLDHGYQMRVRFLKKTPQNQALYQTERVG
jgi:hypothetical protein